MAKLRSIIALSLLVHLLRVAALYEDQVGQFDWRRSYIGRVRTAAFADHRLIVTTDANVLAALRPESGEIEWRQALEPAQRALFAHVERGLAVTVGGAGGGCTVRGWEPAGGGLLFEWALAADAQALWAVRGERLHHVALRPGAADANAYALRSGAAAGAARVAGAWVGGEGGCALSHPHLACVHAGRLHWASYVEGGGGGGSEAVRALTGSGEPARLVAFEAPFVLLEQDGGSRLVRIEDGAKVVDIPLQQPNALLLNDHLYQLEINPHDPAHLLQLHRHSLADRAPLPSTPIAYPRGLGAPHLLAAHCPPASASCDLLLASTDAALTLVRLPAGGALWTREEALASVLAVEFFELPVSALDASIDREFRSDDIPSMLAHRLAAQAKQLYAILFGGQSREPNALVRDEFGLHKIIVLATKVGKLFGIDTLTGSIVWSYRLPNVSAYKNGVMSLFVQRTARFAPLPAQCVLLARDGATGAAIVFAFDPITGLSVNGVEKQNYQLKQAMLLPNNDQNHIKPLVLVANDNSVHFYPNQQVVQPLGNVYFYLIEKTVLRGYKLGLELDQMWEVNLHAPIVSVSARLPGETVHSQGRVLPDRSVYYKYVNPNLVAVATLADDAVHKHVLSVYLIDGVSGLVVYSTSHKRARGEVHLVHSENWLVYTLFNERHRRYEIVASELYEGAVQSNRTAFSSFSVAQLPHVQTQSYILPVAPAALAVTQTERGITSKLLLVGLSTGAVAEVPWLALQPRFADVACGPEESCIPYMPEVALPGEAYINYNVSVERMRGVQVAPARLESTCHVLVYGVDLFYTRVAPSKTFDVLKEDFDHRLIVLVLFALVGASYGCKYLAARKTLRQAWK